MNTPKDDAEALVAEFLPFAEHMLKKHREFFPFGGSMDHQGEITHEGAWDGDDQPPSQNLIDLLRDAHKQMAAESKIKACCIVYDIRTIPPGKQKKQDAIAVEIDHVDGYSVVVVFPYSFGLFGKLRVEPAFATQGENASFQL